MTDHTHTPRMNLLEIAPEVYAAMRAFGKTTDEFGLDAGLREMLKIRASQINACAFCLDMHVQEARRHGITDDRMHLIAAWREAPCFNEAERAAFELTEAVTRVSEGGVSDSLYERVRTQFTERQYVGLLTTITAINSWNRLMVGVGNVPSIR
ncbi:alkyl hydroperoxide reductase AhpD [Capsulimonas corticalis]|uniref:Alkyl hydroperoxide reductase AhpD n=1 Tax=Capsulimonas corticalis TaxID=2219043 RepID=A0A402D2B5_9BACT|nr:carboxymuconolactone decarboxylase family protein [Capsulimonas corticalis]BDI30008.1 alkyl hydroperoxide reductase AhpD [Capsulimonas corticalis]